MRGKEAPNTIKRKELLERKNISDNKCTLQYIWEQYAELNVAKPTLKTDLSLLKYIPHLLTRSPEDITTLDIDTLRQKLSNTPSSRKKNGQVVMLAPATVRHVLGLIRILINFAVKRDICPMPQHLHFEMPKVDNQKTEMLSDEELARLLQALNEEADQDAASLIRLALVTGMRKGALLALRWDDCDFERRIIRLRGESAKKGTTDYIPMNDAAYSILQAIQKQDSPFVFPGKDGGQRVDYRRISRRVKQKAGLPEDFRPLHGLRHNFASRLASSGNVELYTLQKLLTHNSPQMTQRYAHLRDDTLMKASKEADAMLDSLQNKIFPSK